MTEPSKVADTSASKNDAQAGDTPENAAVDGKAGAASGGSDVGKTAANDTGAPDEENTAPSAETESAADIKATGKPDVAGRANKPGASPWMSFGLSEDDIDAAGEAYAEGDPSAVINALMDQLDALNAERDELKAQNLRTLADMENLRKRTQVDVSKAQKFAVEKFAENLLAVADNFERALQHAPDGVDDDAKLKGFLDGIEATQRQLLATFEKFDVVPVKALGERLDPHLHNAVQQVANPDVPEGTITTVYQQGYEIAGRLLRPAMVVVSTGGPAATAASESATDASSTQIDAADDTPEADQK